MIAFVNGRLVEKEATHVVVEAGGIGYYITISLNTYSALPGDEKCKLFTYFHVKEDIQALYGFATKNEKIIFEHLISISGIGPNTAIVMLSSLTPEEVQHAIVSEDVRTIQGVKGIGAKTAQRVILELKDKLSKAQLEASATSSVTSSYNTVRQEALSALITLGITKAAAEKSIDKIIKSSENKLSLEELIKLALKAA